MFNKIHVRFIVLLFNSSSVGFGLNTSENARRNDGVDNPSVLHVHMLLSQKKYCDKLQAVGDIESSE